MWRFSNQDVSSGAQVPLSVPLNGRVGPPLLSERKFTNPGGCVALGLGFLVVASTYALPYAIGEPDATGGRLLFGTDYKGVCLLRCSGRSGAVGRRGLPCAFLPEKLQASRCWIKRPRLTCRCVASFEALLLTCLV
jgi:hypothetical protein